MRSDIFDAIIIHNNIEAVQELEALLMKMYPNANVELLKSYDETINRVNAIKPDIVFLAENTKSNAQFEICTQLRSITGYGDITIVFFTSETDEDYLKQSLYGGCDAYLINPINESALIMQIQFCLKIKQMTVDKGNELQDSLSQNEREIEEQRQNEKLALQRLNNRQQEIEARIITENELRASEMRLSRAELASKSGNWELDLNSQIMHASAGAIEIYGTKYSTSQYDNIKAVPLEKYREELDKSLKDLVTEGVPYKVNYKIKRVDTGEIREILSTATFDKENNKVFGVVRDITDEVRTQEALHHSESLFKAILDSSPDSIALTDMDGTFLSCSKSVVKTFGYNNEQDFIGKNFRNFMTKKSIEKVLCDFEKSKTGEYSGEPDEYEYIKRDGTTFDLEVSAGLIRDSKGEISKLLFLARDITERKRNEQKLLKSEIEFRTIWDYSPNGLGLSDENGNIIRVNKAMSDIFEIDIESFKGKTVLEIAPLIYDGEILDIYKYHFNNRTQVSHLELELEINPNKKKWLQFDFSFLDFEQEKPLLLCNINDITARKNAEDKIRNLTRLYALLGQINQAIVRQRNDKELMQQICNVAIEYGELKFAWFAEFDKNNTIKYICESGKNKNYIDSIQQQFIDLDVENKIFKEITTSKRVICCNDISQDIGILVDKNAALNNDFHSMAILPIERRSELSYLLYLYSDKKDFFNDEEQKLLTEIAQDISYAFETIDADKLRLEAESALKESENRYNAFINNNVDMIFVKDNLFKYLVVNDSFAQFIGLRKDQILNKTNRDFASGEMCHSYLKSDKRALYSDTPIIVFEKIGDRIFETTKFKMPLKDGQFGIGGIAHDITYRKKQELALEESRLELESIYNNAPVLMCVLDENKKILFINEEFRRFFELQDHIDKNLKINDILGCNHQKFHYKLCIEPRCEECTLQKAIEKTLAEGSTERNFEYHSIKNANNTGAEIYLLGSSSLIHSSGQRKILLTFIDITDRKKAEKALSNSNNRFELAMNVANMAWWELNLITGEIIFGKQKAEFLGYEAKDFTHLRDFELLLHPDDKKDIDLCFENHMKGLTDKIEFEYRMLTKEGKYKYFYEIGSITKRGSEGEPLVISGLVLDITERKKSDEALEKSEMFLRTFINNSPFQIWARDENNIGILENKMLVDNYGSILGKKPISDSRITKELALKWDRQNNMVLKGGIVDEEIEFVIKGKKIDYQQIIFPINLNNKVIGIAGFSIDITERKKSQIALRESQEELKNFAAHLQFVREEERVSLSREIHDELGQILVAIKFDLGMLKNKIYKTADKQEIELYEHLSLLVDNTLKTTRRIMTDLRPELLDMLGFVDAIKSHIKSFVERQGIVCLFESKITHLQLDSQRSVALFRIVQESLNNILKHAKASRVIIKLEMLNEDNYFLEITDNGCGFNTSKKTRSDSYGLLGMRERAYLLDAKLSINSKINSGTSIRIDFKAK